MKNFTPPNVAKQVARHFIKFRKPRHPYAIWVNQIATGRRGVIFKKLICKATSKATQNALWAFWGTFAVAVNF
jgi:hypothetical protein